MENQRGGALAAAGVLALGAGGHVAAYGHLFPVFSKDTGSVVRHQHHFELPEGFGEGAKEGGKEVLKHCAGEADTGENCVEP
jgi:hypothetical protein